MSAEVGDQFADRDLVELEVNVFDAALGEE